jgi:hypothetical protein
MQDADMLAFYPSPQCVIQDEQGRRGTMATPANLQFSDLKPATRGSR